MLRIVHLSAAAAFVLAGCSTVNRAANEVGETATDVVRDVTEPDAIAHLRDAQGRDVGTVSFENHDNGVEIDVEAEHLAAGTHGIHLHAVGTCTPPDFTSAGGHFNPTGRQHGLSNASGPHAGDLPNLVVGSDGEGEVEYTNDRISLGTGANSLFDADGTAFVVHAGPDDQRSDPSGNSGGRTACGVVEKR